MGFLRASVKFWDPKDHVFQFNTTEICTTIEEFSAILGYDPNKKSVAVSCDPRHKEFLSDALGLPTSITDSMIKGHVVNLRAIISRLIDKCTYGVIDNMQKNFGLALCMVCSRRRGFVDARAISVVNQIKDGDNLVSLILVETLLGLDAVFHGEEFQNFLGSPLTLQIWLMERLDMTTKPSSGNYGPSSFLSRAVIKTECQIESDWIKFLDKKSSTSIQWDCYWWKCPPPILGSLGSYHIFLVGLQRATFYKGDRLLRKFKYEQGMIGGKRRRPFSPVNTNPIFVKNMLLGLEMADQVDQSFVKVHFHKMTTEYSNWLVNMIVDKEAEMVAMRKQFL